MRFAVEAPEQSVRKLKQAAVWDENELLGYEKENLGLYLSGHPIDVYLSEVRQIAGTELVDISVDFGKKEKKHGLFFFFFFFLNLCSSNPVTASNSG